MKPTTPPADDDDLIERLDAGLPPRSLLEAAARAPYERLFARIRDLTDIEPPRGWEDRAVGRWLSAKRPISMRLRSWLSRWTRWS